MAQAQKSKAFEELHLGASLAAMTDLDAVDPSERMGSGVFSDDDLDMQKVLSGEYNPQDNANRNDIRRRSVLPGTDAEAEDVMPQVDKKSLPSVFTSVRTAPCTRAPSSAPPRCSPCGLRTPVFLASNGPQAVEQ